MKKSSFIALIMGTVSGMLFALGMCMALIPEWSSFQPGVVLGGTGLILGLVTLLVWRRMEGKAPVHLSGRGVAAALAGMGGALTLGVGMCFCMVWGRLAAGVAIGCVGILILLCLIPLTRGLRA